MERVRKKRRGRGRRGKGERESKVGNKLFRVYVQHSFFTFRAPKYTLI